MELTFTINTDDIYEREMDFESLLSEELTKQVIAKSKGKLGSESFKRFSELTADTIVSNIKLRLENFLSEDVALTDKWGKPTFIGSIEDLIKQQFDEIILRPVNSNGETLQGCTSSGNTWIEWQIKRKLDDITRRSIKSASDLVQRDIKKHVDKTLLDLKNTAIKEQVGSAFAAILKKSD